MSELIQKWFYFDYLMRHSKTYEQKIYFLDRRKLVEKIIEDWYKQG